MGAERDRLAVDPDRIAPNRTIARQRNRYAGIREPYGDPEYKKSNALGLDLTYLFDAPKDPSPMSRSYFEEVGREATEAWRKLQAGQGNCLDNGVPMLGWMDLPVEIPKAHLDEINRTVTELRDRIDAFISLGIGGSYLGIEATVKALTHIGFNQLDREARGGAPEIYFLGQNMDPDFFRDTLDLLEGKRIGVNVISKSGTTTETAVAFRILRSLLEAGMGERAKEVILATTDLTRGALRRLSEQKGYKTFVVPDNIGGRFSVMTDVGLVGIAMAGIDIEELLAGAADMRHRVFNEPFSANPALQHAACRTAAYRKGKKVEVVATNSAALYQIGRFMEQLFPESEGHGGKGLWVSPSMYSEKLHANGQMVQDGERNILETFLMLERHDNELSIPLAEDDLDGLNYLPENGRNMNFINRLVIEGPAYAHYTGGVPSMTLAVPARSAYCLGQLFYLLEASVAISGTLLGHNPFIQPGVEDYKKAMFALAGKPGMEEARKALVEKREAIQSRSMGKL